MHFKVDDPTLWRPRKSSSASINSGSSEDISSDCTSPRAVDNPDNTSASAGPADNKRSIADSSDQCNSTKNENIPCREDVWQPQGNYGR